MARLKMLGSRLSTVQPSRLKPLTEVVRGQHNRLYGRAWRKARLEHLAEHPLCIDCEAEGRTVAATIVDHDRPHEGDEALFWDRSNWRSRCKHHHDQKTAGRDGGFGNPIRER